MIVAGMVKSSLVDYPGLVSCVLFLPFCNFDCYYCHNRSLIDGSFTELDLDSVYQFLEKRKNLLDAVVISGGEPTLQPDLFSHLEKVKSLGYKIKLDTNGSSPSIIQSMLNKNLCDYVAVDYKAPKAKYESICGNDAEPGNVLETINILVKNACSFEVRTTVIPELSKEDLICMAKELPFVPKYVLNRYRKPENFRLEETKRIEKSPYTKEQLDNFISAIKPFQPNVIA
jgi:anaerobic ribonucleoside-triphosphate reductase activating protein